MLGSSIVSAAFYLQGGTPPHLTLNRIVAGRIPFVVIQVIAIGLR